MRCERNGFQRAYLTIVGGAMALATVRRCLVARVGAAVGEDVVLGEFEVDLRLVERAARLAPAHAAAGAVIDAVAALGSAFLRDHHH